MQQCHNYLRNGQLEDVKNLVARVLDNGVIYLDPSKNTDFEQLLQKLGATDQTTFVLSKTTKSRLNNDLTYYTYQQFYKGLLVEGGGYTVSRIGPGSDPCAETYMLFPFILGGVYINENPAIPQSAIPGIIQSNKVLKTDLIVSHNIEGSCEYKLAWRVTFNDTTHKTAWVDAQNGIILGIVDSEIHLNAPTLTYGTQNLNNQIIDEKILLRSPDEKITIFDFCQTEPLDVTEWEEGEIPSTTTSASSWGTETATTSYQTFYVATQIVPNFEDLVGLDFTKVNISVCPNRDTKAYVGSTMSATYINISSVDGNSAAVYDAITHELSHVYLFGFFPYTVFENRSLHEGISDIIGTYMESLVQGSSGIDWVMGDDIPGLATSLNRNLMSPTLECPGNPPTAHENGLPIGHWYYLVSSGGLSPAGNIPALGPSKAINILLETLPVLGTAPTYQNLMSSMLTIVLDKYGRCSDEFLSVSRAWEKCMSTGYANINGHIPSCNYSINGYNEICEESEFAQFCIQGGLPGMIYHWTLIGPNSAGFESQYGMEGNHQYGGNCLTLINFPQFSYYPRYFIVEAYAPSLGTTYIQRMRFKLADCDGDDPNCGETEFGGDDEAFKTLVLTHEKGIGGSDTTRYKIFDYYGKQLFEGDQNTLSGYNLPVNTPIVIMALGVGGQILSIERKYIIK